MIVAAPHLEYGLQLFRNTFARLLGEAWEVGSRGEQVKGWRAAAAQRTAQGYLGSSTLIDGEWPRLAHLNQPLHPDFLQKPHRGHFLLAGQFRRAKFYVGHRERIKNEWFSFESEARRPERGVVVLALAAKLDGKPRQRRYCLRPTPKELRSFLPGVDFADVLVLTSLLIQREHLRPDYDRTAAKVVMMDQATSVATARQARVVVANLAPHAWWAGFLSSAEKVILLTYGGEDRPCKTCETALVGKPKLVFEDVTTRHVDLPLSSPKS
ncbi:MAG: hypothetical protein ACR2OZ_14965 [Verrucomicrobiales bacterium]